MTWRVAGEPGPRAGGLREAGGSTRRRRPTTSAGTSSAPGRSAEAVMAEVDGEPVGFALWFPTFSTFRGQPGLYLEDLFVRPEYRGRGIGKALLASWPGWRRRARLRPARMVGARLERAGDRLLPRPGGPADGRVDRLPDRRRAARPPGGARPGPRDSALDREDPEPDEPLLPSPHRADGRLRARRAAARRRIHQAEHQREPVSRPRRGSRQAIVEARDRPAAALPRPGGAPRSAGPPRGCTASSPTWSWRATARTTC